VKGRWCGIESIYKVRNPLPYRHPTLDSEIRRQRTIREAEMMKAARRAGVPSPHLYFLDNSNSTLVMEFVEGNRMKDLVLAHPEDAPALFEELGAAVAKLHSSGIMHGDLTTANLIKRRDGLVFIDFGLSVSTVRVEDHAVDLRLIKETIVGAHAEVSKGAIPSLMEGYRRVVGGGRARAVFRQLESIEMRGRYATVE